MKGKTKEIDLESNAFGKSHKVILWILAFKSQNMQNCTSDNISSQSSVSFERVWEKKRSDIHPFCGKLFNFKLVFLCVKGTTVPQGFSETK